MKKRRTRESFSNVCPHVLVKYYMTSKISYLTSLPKYSLWGSVWEDFSRTLYREESPEKMESALVCLQKKKEKRRGSVTSRRRIRKRRREGFLFHKEKKMCTLLGWYRGIGSTVNYCLWGLGTGDGTCSNNFVVYIRKGRSSKHMVVGSFFLRSVTT